MSGSTTAQKIIRGIIKYRETLKNELTHYFKTIQDNPNPKTIFLTCVDSRVVASRITQADPGVFYIIRNPGNMIPSFDKTVKSTPVAEPAALELACVYNKVHSIAVCGHSDCKTLHLLFDMYKDPNKLNKKNNSHLHKWLFDYGYDTLARFAELEKHHFNKAIKFRRSDNHEFLAYIDPKNEFDHQEKFSQLHVLEQLKNLRTYKFLNDKLNKNVFHAHALWFDVYKGELYMFSYDEKSFVKVTEDTFEKLYDECGHTHD